MKKRITNRQLGRDHHARQALFKGLLSSLIQYEEIQTTSAKARAVRGIFEKLITKARLGSLHARRQLQSVLQNRSLVKKLVNDIAPRFQKIPGGYTKLTIIGNRRGDNATMVKLALTHKSIPSKGQKVVPAKVLAKKATKSATKSVSLPKAKSPLPVSSVKQVPTSNLVGSKNIIGIKKGER